MSSFSLVLTEKCDWNCGYCYFSKLNNQRGPKLEIYQKHLPYIKKIMDTLNCHDILVNIDIQGGEVGSIPLEILQYFFQTIQYPIAVSTNGEFLRKKYHNDDKIREYLKMVMWHVTDDFNSKIETDYNDDEIFISKGIVHNDEDEMISFIKKNSHIIFDYVEFEYDIEEEIQMNPEKYVSLLTKLATVPNVTDNTIEMLQRRITETPHHRENCKRLNDSIVIDLVNEKICLCQRQLNECIELNRLNLVKRLQKFPQYFFQGGGCKSCTRLYAGKYNGNVIERTLTRRRIDYGS